MLSGSNGLSTLVAQPLILTPTRLKNTLEENKKRLNIFVDLKEGEKLGRVEEMVEEKKTVSYYKEEAYRGQALVRWWYGEGRLKTINYLDEDFTEFCKFLDEMIEKSSVDPFCNYVKITKDTRDFINKILPGLNNLKKTYSDCVEMVAKVDSIILTLLDFKEKTNESVSNKSQKPIKLMVGRVGQSFEV
tara:strand:+ start:609 stop:1175 length:567 start_codon:yes stop_codon:yes gene_type:complete